MTLDYALYQGYSSTADKYKPIAGTYERYTGPSGETSRFESRILTSKLSLSSNIFLAR
ncbi:MAG: hypothetical protein QXQ11_05595 [Candidatus Bathyarchaeia archaeon]